MSLRAGIVGLPNVGKSTLFNAITKAGAEAANYPFCTIDPNVGVVEVPDDRLSQLADIVHPQKIVPTTFEFVDIAGLVKGASRGEGLGNKFLAHIREVDAIIHVVRCFEDPEVTHVSGAVDPVSDMETIELELIIADMETVSRRLERTRRQAKSGDQKVKEEAALLETVLRHLEKGLPARRMPLLPEQSAQLGDLHLLTIKPVLYAANVAEGGITQSEPIPHVEKVRSVARLDQAEVVVICAQVEAEIAELDGEDRGLFLADLGLKESGLDRLIKTSYELLGLITYFTAGPQEVRAWTIRRGTRAPQAAAVIHTDFERGFIRAEVVACDDLLRAGSHSVAREQGKLRLEGKDYVMCDGDVAHFRFNV